MVFKFYTSTCVLSIRTLPNQFIPHHLHYSMAESKTSIAALREWVVDHKLRAVGCLWLSGITGSIAYNWARPAMKTSVKIIHARLHAQALTLAALAGAAVVEYYDHRTPADKSDPYTNFLHSHKN